MKKIYVIGIGAGIEAIEKAKKILELKEEAEIICVESMDEIPINKRLKSDSTIQQIHKLSAPKIIPYTTFFEDKKRKGHERPYKYHP